MSCKPILPSEFDIKKFSLKPFQQSKRKDLLVTYPNYKQKGGSNLTFQTEWFELSQYGIPSEKFVKSDEDRACIKTPIDPENEGSKHLINMFTQIDNFTKEKFISLLKSEDIDPNLMKNFKQPEKMLYCGLFRKPGAYNSEENNDDAEEQPNKLDFFKVKFDIEYDDSIKKKNTSPKIKTSIFERKRDSNDPEKFSVERHNLKDINKIAELVTYKSKVRMVVNINKLWLMKNPDVTKKYKYGYTMIVKQIEVEPQEHLTIANDSYDTYAFREDNDQAITTKPNDEAEEENNVSSENSDNDD